jgi:diphthine synthase
MLYLIGLGLNKDDISIRALEIIKKCKKVYLETYTTKFPYTVKELEKIIKKKIIEANRELVESDFLVKEAKISNVALLIYGDPLAATTHLALINDARKMKVKVEIIHNASIFNAIADLGLQLYKFGKTTSLPRWQPNFKPTSFYSIIKENLSINAHTLILVDIGLSLKDALTELTESDSDNLFNNRIIIVASRLSTKDQKIIKGKLGELKNKKVKEPFSVIIPGQLHFTEAEALKTI